MPRKSSTKSTKKPTARQSALSNRMTTAKRAGVLFPPTRCTNLIRKLSGAPNISSKAGVQVAAVLEYLVAELLEAGGDVAKE
jgi:hypothetical protein